MTTKVKEGEHSMRKSIMLVAASALLCSSALAQADDTKVGILMDITGPIANFIPPLQNAANLAIKQANEQGGLLGGNAVAEECPTST